MRRVVIDAATFVGWFSDGSAARPSRLEYEAGELSVLVPTSFIADVLGEVARLGWRADRLERLAAAIANIGFEQRDASHQLWPGGWSRASPPRRPRTLHWPKRASGRS